jgi:DNA N-6-adenine-methyltransferase (Dam)
MSALVKCDAARHALAADQDDGKELTVAGKAAAKIHAAEKAAEIAKRVKDPEALHGALLIILEAQREFAAEYRAKFPRAGRPENSDRTVRISADKWCLGYGFHDRTVRRWLALLVPEKFDSMVGSVNKRCQRIAHLEQAIMHDPQSVEWYTPARYIDAVREVLGEIDLDPASCAEANAVVRAKQFFTKKDKPLERDWRGTVFMNPPYGTDNGDSVAAMFCTKALAEFDQENITEGIILVNSLHSQPWQAPLYSQPICFVDHRIKFVSGDGEENKNPTMSNIFVYLGSDEKKFARVFSRLGYVMFPSRVSP